jgi:nicotinamidase-related amidase
MADDEREAKARRRLAELAVPAHTAVLTMELQVGVVGDDVMLPDLVDEVKRAGTLEAAGRVCAAARSVGARVVHCTVETRPDGAGFVENCKIFNLAGRGKRATGHYATEAGTFGAQVVPALGLADSDIVVARGHGMSPFTSTSLDQILRNLGIRTVVATGVSVNLGIFGMAMTALDLGYQVIVVRDAVAGVPAAYAQTVIDNSLSLISTVVTCDELLATWNPASG